MSDVPPDDWQRWQDEIQRCHLLSVVDGVVVTSMSLDRRNNDARYYTERARVLTKVGPERAVAFLREEALAALAGKPIGRWPGTAGRYWHLHDLEYGTDYRNKNASELLNELTDRARLPRDSVYRL